MWEACVLRGERESVCVCLVSSVSGGVFGNEVFKKPKQVQPFLTLIFQVLFHWKSMFDY